MARRKKQSKKSRHKSRKVIDFSKIRSSPFILAGFIAIALSLITAIGGTGYALNLEDHDAFCASCHTQPESQFYQNSLETNPTTLAVFHTQKGVRCIDCHSGYGPIGRLEGLTQGAKDLIAFYRGHYHNPAITTNELGDSSCLKCHQQAMTDRSFNNHFHLFLSRWQGIDQNAAHCVDCHTSHSSGQSAQSFLSVPSVQQICQDCHSVLAE